MCVLPSLGSMTRVVACRDDAGLQAHERHHCRPKRGKNFGLSAHVVGWRNHATPGREVGGEGGVVVDTLARIGAVIYFGVLVTAELTGASSLDHQRHQNR